jgi:eukaryotic-like serine/threonine-protein kinase
MYAIISSRRAAEIVAEVADALAEVHKHGIIHQDIKPHNILIDPAGHPRLIDFGLAKLKHAWDRAEGESGGGTPSYMAPEQARGEEAAIGTRTDIFALGGVLFHLLTGSAPFAATTTSAALSRAAENDFDRAALNAPGIPRRLAAIVLKAMASDPADRYASAEDLATDLRRYLRRPQIIFRVAAGCAAALLVIGIGFYMASRQSVYHSGGMLLVVKTTDPEMTVQVVRQERYLDLKGAVPIKPSDSARVTAKIPPGYHAVLFYRNATGVIEQLQLRTTQEDGFDRVVYPEPGSVVPFTNSGPGTELLLLVASPDAASLAGLTPLIQSQLPGLPELP